MNEREYGRMYAVEERHWWYVALHELVVAAVEEQRRQKGALTILDAGCGTGRLCQLLGHYGEVQGCDLSPLALGFCRERGLTGLFPADLASADLGEGRYDVITSIDVLYHRAIADEAAVLARFHRALRPGGLLVLNLVAHEYLRSSHDIAVHTRRRYTRQELVALLEGAGFSVEKASYRLAFLFIPIACYRLAKRFLKRGEPAESVDSDVSLPAPFLNGLLLRITRAENRLLRRLSLPVGTSVFVIARRPPTAGQ